MITIKNIPSWYVIKSDTEDFTAEDKLATYTGDMDLTDFVTAIRSYISNMYGYGVQPVTSGGYSRAILTNDATNDFKLKHLLMISCINGALVEDYYPLVKVLATDMDNPVPDGLPNCIKAAVMSEWDGEGNEEDFTPVELEAERLKTWTEWANLDTDAYNGVVVDDYHYFGAHFGNDKGAALSIDELLLIYAADDAELVDEDLL